MASRYVSAAAVRDVIPAEIGSDYITDTFINARLDEAEAYVILRLGTLPDASAPSAGPGYPSGAQLTSLITGIIRDIAAAAAFRKYLRDSHMFSEIGQANDMEANAKELLDRVDDLTNFLGESDLLPTDSLVANVTQTPYWDPEWDSGLRDPLAPNPPSLPPSLRPTRSFGDDVGW